MPVVISCPSCKQKLKAPDAAIGKAVKCPGCGSAIKVPVGDAPEPAAAPQRQAAAAARAPAPPPPPRRDEPEDDFEDDRPRKPAKAQQDDFDDEGGSDKPAAYLGVGFDPETSDLVITDVYEKMPAAKAGLKVGDVITRLDGKKVKERGDLADFLRKKKPGDTIGVEVKGDDEEIEVKLGKRPAD